MDNLDNLNLKDCEKLKLKNLLLESKPMEIQYIQKKIYIVLMNSKIIILNNSDQNTYSLLKKVQEDSYIKKRKRNAELKFKPVNFWTKEEEEYIIKYFFVKNLSELSLKLQKSYYQILLKASELKLIIKKKWESIELKYLKENIEISNYELAKELKRSINSIKSKKRMIMSQKIKI